MREQSGNESGTDGLGTATLPHGKRWTAVDEGCDGWAVKCGDFYLASMTQCVPEFVPGLEGWSEGKRATYMAAAPGMAKALREIAELTKRRQLPLTNQINDIATEILTEIDRLKEASVPV